MTTNQVINDQELTRSLEKWLRGIIGLFLDPLGLLAKAGGPKQHLSIVFTVTTTATANRSLSVVDDLVPGLGRPEAPTEGIPKGAVRFEPPELAPDQTSFRLVVDAATIADRPGATYWGSVSVGDANPPSSSAGPGLFSSVETVPVWIVIP
jgi:hypothetical protein